MQQDHQYENTYYQPKALNMHLRLTSKPFLLPQTEASTHRFSQIDYITEPTSSMVDPQGPQTDRTQIRNNRQIVKQIKPARIEPESNILNEEKNKLQTKFNLLDSFTIRHSQHQLQIKNEIKQDVLQRKFSEQKIGFKVQQLDEEQESHLILRRNQFFYTSLRIKDRYSPLTLQIRIKQGDQNTRLRIFASPKFIQPNRFNASVEVSGRQLKYTSNSELFQEETLYVAILALNELSIGINIEFGRPTTKRVVQRERKEKSVHEFPPDLELQIEEIMMRRRLRYANQQNYVELNKCSQMSRRTLEKPQTPKHLEIKQKIRTLKVEQNLKRMAQLQVHDIAQQIHRKQLELQREIKHREYVQKSWFKIVCLINILAPGINEFIEHQRQLVAKNMKKQISLIQLLNKIKKKVEKFGPNCKLRTILQGKYCLQLVANNSRMKAKKRAQTIITQMLQNNITCFITESKGTHVVNLIKKCVNRLVKHKISRIEFMSNLKLYLSVQYKQLYQIALRYSKQSDSAKNKRDPIHFLLYDASFLHQMTKKLLSHVFEKWNKNFITFRNATKEEREKQGKKGIALFWQPPKLFELPQDIVVRLFLFEELEKRGLITGEYKE
ncbi:unnamed protein product (macronuclear) [Paramecium tetraurelia]|uniref:MSP domain-containing protein n=1 Tax=Paramecium tetraurelia TaxID=5888 RepID=A0BQD0_PARTE|nr:uncharacterized protein GSPATT00030976001 [Paramecium tetraurelia]CAK60747.1 unnamed protein product [Paramecium tetraurelia]|eukprot:XP_001428145.1 hypothetical protein (macronuclear) [Paramecium tetraurelia strain d4-2]